MFEKKALNVREFNKKSVSSFPKVIKDRKRVNQSIKKEISIFKKKFLKEKIKVATHLAKNYKNICKEGNIYTFSLKKIS